MTRKELQQAVRVLRAGGIVAYPTESCFGLGCDPRYKHSLRNLIRLKGRSWEKGLLLISDRCERLAHYVDWPDTTIQQQVNASWPGPFSWALPARKGVSRWLRGRHASVVVRVTAHPPARALCQQLGGALVSTSANRHGRPAARSAAMVQREFRGQVDYILPGKIGAMTRPSEIRDAISGAIIRPA
ncbi:MAG: tRNA threonylcarbamoyladenosine biosynthesis protein RimN [Gammaproteobacteria bacterium]|nr:tRNA threonylcarbamoyladenosine biosynthesis protein RimN [Gammaproteobacteria bacterium]